MKAMNQSEVIIAGGLLPAMRDKYFRVGHMGSVTRGDILTTSAAIENALKSCGHSVAKC